MGGMGNNLNVLLIGIDYFASRGSSDKNFWHLMLPILAEEVQQIIVISFNYRKILAEIQTTARRNIRVYNVRPSHLGIDLRPDPATVHNREKCHSHFKSPPRSPVEYFLSFVRIRPLVRLLVAEQNITNIHCMDNFGPAMHLLRHWVSPVPVSVSAMGYYARGPLHNRYLQLCYRGMDAVVPYSVAYRQKLLRLGLPEQQLHAIPWGIDADSCGGASTPDERRQLKCLLGIDPGRQLILWTGFIQQMKEKDLCASLDIAQSLVQRRDDVQFVFALKPECYRPGYRDFSAPRLRILSTTNDVFLRLLRTADYLLSPVTHTDSIITPPLTWIEAMATGVPVVTNKVPGVDAVVLSGENGFVADSVDDIGPVLDTALSRGDQERMRERAREHIMTHYRVARSAVGYETLWRELHDG